VNAAAGPIESASIATPATAANEHPANLLESIVFSFVFPNAAEKNMERMNGT